jgi:dihydrofolate reductase
MGKVVVSEFVTLDGVMEDPGGSEGIEGGGWAFRFERGEAGNRFKLDELTDAGALLLGRTTYEGFAAAWPGRTDEQGFADRMNSMPKHVATRTRTELDWNAHVLQGDAVDAVRRLKEQGDANYLIYGSPTLVNALAPHGLIDEYRLMTFPVVVGSGRRLFDEGPQVALRLADSWTTTTGVAILTYVPAAQ